jgi:cytochrome c-type biogenesis protein CcmF
MFVPLMALLMATAAVGLFTRWKATPVRWLARMLIPVLAASLTLAMVAATLQTRSRWAVAASCFLAAWIVFAGIRDVFYKTRNKGLLTGLPTLGRKYWAMQLAHLGFAVCALGAVLTSVCSVDRDLRMTSGKAIEVGGYDFIFNGTTRIQGPNYVADRGSVRVLRDGREIAILHPEKRVYQVQRTPMTEAAIEAGFTRDLFVALGEPLADGAWAVRVQIKPFVRWIWVGVLLMAFGGSLAATDRRYRARSTRLAQERRIRGART